MPDRIARRTFFKAGAAAAALGAVPHAWAATDGGAQAASPAGKPAQGTYREAARDVPIVDEADVVVCGAGPAGVTAAIAAARQGAKTRLIETAGCLGGVWTCGLLSWILDWSNKSGMIQEMARVLSERGAAKAYRSALAYDVEEMKILLEEMCLAAGVEVRLHTRVVAAARDEQNRLALAVTESKSGREAFAGKAFIDATGDGDLAALAGCGWDYGHPETGLAQPMSMIALLAGLDPDGVAPFVRELAEPRGLGNPKANLLAEMQRAGVDPSYSLPTLFYIRPGVFCLMANHEYGVDAMNADHVTQATLRSRAEVYRLVGALRALGEPWTDVRIVVTAEHIGVREGRRIHGLYTVSTQDLVEGARHDDAVCRCYFGVDVHATDPAKSKGIVGQGVRARPYDIPYRALVAKDVGGLLMAGRCISGDFIAHSSYRVTGDSVALGEAAGVAAALAAQSNRLPHEVPWKEIREAGKLAPVG